MRRKGLLGCSFPIIIGLAIFFLALFVIGFLAGPLGRSMLPGVHLPEWLSVHQPEPHLPPEPVFHMLGFPITNTIIGAWITMFFLVVGSWAIGRRMKLIPGRLQDIFEALLGWVYDLCRSVAGEENGRKFFPVVTTIFLFVMFNAYLALLPGFGSILVHTAEGEVPLFRGANTDINMPLALALASFFFVEFYGLRTLGIHYLSKFFNFGAFFHALGDIFHGKIGKGLGGLFTGFMNIFTGLLEGLSELIRIVSFTFRLFGNMTAGEILLLVATFLVPWLFAIPFYGLELLIGFLQALIFGGLTLIFLTMAVAGHESEES